MSGTVVSDGLHAPMLKSLPGEGGLAAFGLGKRYRKRPVVRNVSINLKRGEAVGLLGPNGAGKTTLLLHDHRPDAAGRRAACCWTATTSPICRCTAAPGSASATCRRRPRSSAA